MSPKHIPAPQVKNHEDSESRGVPEWTSVLSAWADYVAARDPGVKGGMLAEPASKSSPPAPPPGVTASLTDHQKRKLLPLYSGVVRYFPDALLAVAELSRVGNGQHNPGKALHWDRSKSGDELDSLMRHLVDAGTLDSDQIRHSTKVAWRALANLQKEIERDRK